MSLEHILLGLLQKSASGYDLKATFDNTIRYFWAVELSQIYTTLQRLERKGLLTSKTVPSPRGPDRKVYATTSGGRAQLKSWLMDEPDVSGQRIEYLAQLYFMANAKDLNRTLWFMTDLRRTLVERLRTFRQIEVEWTRAVSDIARHLSSDDFHQYLALRAGIKTMNARIQWCDEAIDLIQQRLKKKSGNKKIIKSTSKKKTSKKGKRK